ncbi:MAG: hypothetical protein ABSH36_16015, partial [Solirubrobacteraceae bacterium]
VASANARLVRALRSTETGYQGMGNAASRGSQAAYAVSQSQTAMALTATRRELQLLQANGY